MAWGSSSLRSCVSLWERLEQNDPTLVDLFILPTKQVTQTDWDRCRCALQRHGGARHLVSIHASGHDIDLDSLRQLAKVLNDTSYAVAWDEIALGSSHLGDDGIQALLGQFQPDARIYALDLSYKSMQGAGFHCLVNHVASFLYLKKLDVSRNENLARGLLMEWLTGDDAPKRLPYYPALEEVNLSECGLTGELATIIVSSFAKVSKLKYLHLSRNPLGTGTLVHGLAHVSPLLVQLSLAQCALTDDLSDQLVPILSQLNALQVLDLSQNAFTEKTMHLVADGLARGWHRLESLALADNPLGQNGIRTLVLSGCRVRSIPLSLLDLSRTQCTMEAARHAIVSSGVQRLRLFDNALGSDGFIHLADSIRGGHATMESLDVAGNGASEEAVVTFLRGLLVTTDVAFESTLRTVIVGGNQGGMTLEELIRDIQKLRPELDIARDRIKKI